jgi:hypothetical protein
LQKFVAGHPHLALVAITLRQAHTAIVNDWGAICHDVSMPMPMPMPMLAEVERLMAGGSARVQR